MLLCLLCSFRPRCDGAGVELYQSITALKRCIKSEWQCHWICVNWRASICASMFENAYAKCVCNACKVMKLVTLSASAIYVHQKGHMQIYINIHPVFHFVIFVLLLYKDGAHFLLHITKWSHCMMWLIFHDVSDIKWWNCNSCKKNGTHTVDKEKSRTMDSIWVCTVCHAVLKSIHVNTSAFCFWSPQASITNQPLVHQFDPQIL